MLTKPQAELLTAHRGGKSTQVCSRLTSLGRSRKAGKREKWEALGMRLSCFCVVRERGQSQPVSGRWYRNFPTVCPAAGSDPVTLRGRGTPADIQGTQEGSVGQ